MARTGALLLPAVIILALFTAVPPRRWAIRLVGAAYLSPAILYWLIIAYEHSVPSGPGYGLDNALLGFHLLSAFLIVPWTALFLIGFLIGAFFRLALRSRKQPASQSREAPWPELPLPDQHGDAIASAPLYKAMFEIADRHGIDRASLARQGRDHDGAIPFIYADARGYIWEARERGASVEYRITQSLDEALYWVFVDAALSSAYDHASKNRVPTAQWTATIAAQQLHLVGLIEARWSARLAEEQKTRRAA